ncbi:MULTISPECIES: hypothetical protein [unclassified Microbacterium]|uniref:hypothetical protein n=1 Tax=unclassified Microbacterium TaxID=2609290 RepID=UPI00301813A2
MNRRAATTISVATLTVVSVLGLTACDPGTPKPTGSSSPSPTAMSTPVASATDRPMPPQADAPKDVGEAIVAANKTYVAYLEAQIPFKKDLSLGAQYLSGYVLQGSPAWNVLTDTAEKSPTSPIKEGMFEWTLNGAMSYASSSTNGTNGQKIENGAVHLFGCRDNTKVTFANAEVPKGSFPVGAVLVYVPDAHAWMIQEDKSLTAADGEMPQC